MSTIVISIGGTDVTAHVVIESARFDTSVNGIAGEAKFRVRDDDSTYAATVGEEVTLTIDGTVEWRGFLTQWTRTYVFPALNVDDFGLTRFFDATCSDINILLTKRFAFNQAHPAALMLGPTYPPHTADTTAIADLVADWLDLSGDGIDTSTLVENVADINEDQDSTPWRGSDDWSTAMGGIAQLPAAIYYIDPDKNLVYTDVDTPNAPFGLSDQPDGVTTKGYREMQVLMDGTGLANDVLAWGAGYGSNVPVFVRDQDATSQSVHGLWQFAQLYYGVYKQATIERIASSIIDGSPEHKRGAKDDKVAVECVTYEPGLRAAQKVDFYSNVFGFNDVIPIRKLTIEFDGPVTPKYSLTLSHDIDAPFGFFDPFLFKWPKVRPPKCPPPLVMGPSGFCILPPTPPGPPVCPPSVCGITDSFDRYVPNGYPFDTASCGLRWEVRTSAGGWSVVPGTLTMTTPVALSAQGAFMVGGITPSVVFTGQVISSGTASSSDYMYFGADTNPDFAEADFSTDGTLEFYTNAPGSVTTTMPFGPDQKFNIRIEAAGANARCKVWLVTDPEPSSWTLETPFDVPATVFDLDIYMGVSRPAIHDVMVATIQNVDATGITACSNAQIDDFQRSESGIWGVATNGNTWTLSSNISFPYVWDVSDDQGQVNISDSHGGNPVAQLIVAATPTVIPQLDVYTDLWVDPVTSTGGATGSTVVTFFMGQNADISTNINAVIAFADDGSAEINVAYQDANGDGGGSSPVAAGSIQGEWLRVHMQLTASALRAAVWPRGLGEPSFQAVSDGDFTAQMLADLGGVALQVGYSMPHASGRPVTDPAQDYYIRVDNTDYAYAGRPCYPVICGGDAITDDFERAAAANWNGTGNPWGYTWGFIDPSGTDGIDSSSYLDGTQAHAVSVSGTLNGAPTVSGLDRYRLNCGSTPALPLDIAAQFTPDYGFSDLPDPPHPGGSVAASSANPIVISQPLANSAGASIDAGIYHSKFWDGSTYTEGTFLYVQSTFADFAQTAVTVGADTTYIIGLNVTSTTATATLYNSSGTVIDTATVTLGSTPDITSQIGFDVTAQCIFYSSSVGFGPANISTDTAIEFVDYTDRPECVPGADPIASSPTNTWVCEQFDVVTTTLTMSVSFLPNSPMVYLNGLLQSQADYTQDGVAGTITFGFTPSPTDNARVCYWGVS